MPKRFENLQFGPMHLRPVLRRRFERHEHLVAWGVATTEEEQRVFHLAMGMVPAIGPALAAAAASSTRRLVVVTSRRLIVLLNRKPQALIRGRAVCFEAQHEYLEISRTSRKSPKFALTAPEFGMAMTLAVANPKKPQGRRLVEALEALTLDPPPSASVAASAPGRP